MMKNPSKIDQLLDLLLDALQERQEARGGESVSPSAGQSVSQLVSRSVSQSVSLSVCQLVSLSAGQSSQPETAKAVTTSQSAIPNPQSIPKSPVPVWQPSIQLGEMMGKLAAVLILLILLINIPINQYGTALARAMPDKTAMIIRDGLLLKGSGEEVYVLEDNHRRWITTLDAFTYYGYRWENVHEVDDAFLAQFPEGTPIYLLMKCNPSPHVYALEDGQKRWVKDIATFEEMGMVWEDIQYFGCDYLRQLPDGPPIPPDAGTPPVP
jgi:hypothetical protein